MLQFSGYHDSQRSFSTRQKLRSNRILCQRIMSARQVFVLCSLLLFLRLDWLVECSPSEIVAEDGIGEMFCERKNVANDAGKPSVLVCTFVMDETKGSETYQSCVPSKNSNQDDESEDCVTARVFIANYKQSPRKRNTERKKEPTETNAQQKSIVEKETSSKFVESQQNDSRNRNLATGGPIIVGQASYRPPYRQQYGLAIGEVLLNFHDLGFRAGKLEDNAPSIELVNWCLELGHAHMEDAELGVVFDDGNRSNQEKHPKTYHIELALQAYDWALKILFSMTTETMIRNMDPVAETSKEQMVHLQYYATIEYGKGEAFSVLGESGISSKDFYSSALESYRKAQSSFEKLRYIYAKLSKTTENSLDYDRYFNQERYYLIENSYAHSCFHLGVSLYSKLILDQNEKINQTNEKIMELAKSQLGVDGNELDIVTALMDQANGGMGGGRSGGGGGNAFGHESIKDMNAILEGNWMEDELNGVGSKEWNVGLEQIARFLDTAILTYHQHANAAPLTTDGQPQKKMKLIVNGVPRKSNQEYEEEERLFPWRASLAMAYEKAATIATMRNQHIRSRELMNLALELYADSILPYYREQETRDRKLKGNVVSADSASPSAMSAMSREYAEVSAGRLYVTLADTTLKLGSYEDSKEAYSKAMDWHMQHQLVPEPDGIFNTIFGDEVTLRQYEDFITTYRQELDEYFKGVKTGYMYRDDSYEAGMLLSIAPLYMAMGKAEPAIRYYKDAIVAYERLAKGDLFNKYNKVALLGVADARFGLSSAYFHMMRYADSRVEHSLSCEIYQRLYGEGTPPETGDEAALEEMKDMIIENYGEEYYEKLKSYYGENSDSGMSTGTGSEGSQNPKVATNFNAFDHDNETMWEDEDNFENNEAELGDKETWTNDEL